jgi:hypothetical protein
MKQDILNIAKVKSEKEFYKLYPTKEAFEKAFPKAFKKAKMGAAMVKKQLTQLTDFANPPQAQMGSYIGGETKGYQNINFGDVYSNIDSSIGVRSQMEEMQDKLDYQKQQDQGPSAPAQKAEGSDDTMQKAAQAAKIAGMVSGVPIGKRGSKVPMYQNGPIGQPLISSPSAGQFAQSDYDITTQFNQNNPGANINAGPNPNYGQQKPQQPQQQKPTSLATTAGGRLLDKGVSALGPLGKPIGQVVNAGRKIKQSIDQAAQARQSGALASLALQSSSTRQEETKRRYNRDQLVNKTSPAYGTGYDPLQATAEYGASIGGNPTELQNMYSSGDMYSDLGYEPLNDSDQVKQYRAGGRLRMAMGGLNIPTNPTFDAIGKGADIGGDVVSGLIDMGTEKRMNQNQQIIGQTAFQSASQGMQNQNAAFMKEGGWVSHDWQPQVITQFGGYNLKDLLRDDPTMDTLRAGGNVGKVDYTAPSQRAMSTERMAMGGQLKTTWGGHAEPISYNPYGAGSGETVMFKSADSSTGAHSQSDGNGHTGIGVKYGQSNEDDYTDYAQYGTEQADADVEVEKGEPANEIMDKSTGETSMVVWGDMKIPSYGVSELKDPKAKNKKFKSYANELAKIEAKQNKIIEKATDELEYLDPNTPFEKLKAKSLYATIDGANMTLKGLGGQKDILSGIQDAILKASTEFGLKSADLAKGKITREDDPRMAKFGGKFTYAQNGAKETKDLNSVSDLDLKDMYEKAKKQKRGKAVADFQRAFHAKYPDIAKQILGEYDVTNLGKSKGIGKSDLESNVDQYFGPRTERYRASLDRSSRVPLIDMNRKKIDINPPTNISTRPPVMNSPKSSIPDRPDLMDLWKEIQPYTIGSDQETFDSGQIRPELMALATNPLEAVQAQTFKPLLETPYSVSYQDILNANQGDFNALQRQVGYSPAALAELSAKKYAANAAAKGQEFRENQGLAMGAYNRNRALLNDSTLKNLAILDQQYERGAKAKSATKQEALAAYSSIADKMAKHKRDNKELGVYENMYNYRFGPKGKAYNVNAPYEFNLDVASLNADELETAKKYKELQEKKGTSKGKMARNGSIVKLFK